jgi:hypothetical protein|tara:strand:+ start:11401 stop:11559 length:159 start_codon:yes stop_codon:yes gene_type:complete
MGASKQMMMEESDRIEREEYDEDGNPKGSQEWEVLEKIMKAKKINDFALKLD